MRQTKIFQTDENAYEVTQLAADKEGRAAFLRAQRLAFKASGGLDSLVAEMSEADLDYFCELFSKYTKLIRPDGKKPQLAPVFGDHFSGADGWFEMAKWLAFCLGLNFGPFFLHLFADGGAIKAAALEGAGPVANSVPTGSPGESSPAGT